MNRSLLAVVLRQAEALAGPADATPDADLLRAFAARRDEAAFAELVRRHGPMVWAVGRHLLPNNADAEDAFQATFLALVRGAKTLRGAAVGAWLHGVAVRVAAKVRRSAVRRKQREEKVAAPEAGGAVPVAVWDDLLAAVHEEVRQLPEALRTAFVLCDLEGVRQPDAAARLGWKLGTLSGRLTKARQQLVERLARRGIAAGALGLGAVAAGGAVPAAVVSSALALATAPGAVPAAVLKLALEVSPVVSRTKLLAATVLVAGGLGLGVGAGLMSNADAQTGGGGSGGRPGGPPGAEGGRPGRPQEPGAGPGRPGAPGTPGGSEPGGAGRDVPGTPGGPPSFPGGPGGPGRGPGGGPMGPGPGGMPGMPPGMSGGVAASRSGWEYKFDEKPRTSQEFIKLVRDAGEQGWELVGVTEFDQPARGGGGGGGGGFGGGGFPGGGDFGRGGGRGGDRGEGGAGGGAGDRGAGGGGGRGAAAASALVVFKRPTRPAGGAGVAMGGGGMMMGSGGGMIGPGGGGPGGGFGRGRGGEEGGPDRGRGEGGVGRPPMGGGGEGGGGRPPMGGAPADSGELTIIRLKHSNATQLAKTLSDLFSNRPTLRITAEAQSNSLLMYGTPADIQTVKKLVVEVDIEGVAPRRN